jgi:hypothetical protein
MRNPKQKRGNMTLDSETLCQFTSSTNWYRHSLIPRILYTDGAKYVADVAGAYWLLDYIAIAQRIETTVRAEAFQVWKLDVKNSAATSTCEDGNDRIVHNKPSRSPTSQNRASSCGAPTIPFCFRLSIDLKKWLPSRLEAGR